MSDGWNDAGKPSRRARRKEQGKGGGRMKARHAKALRAHSVLALVPSEKSLQNIINLFGVVKEDEEDTAGGKFKTTRQQFREMGLEVPETAGYIDVYGNFVHVMLMKGVDPEDLGDISNIKPVTLRFTQQLQLIGQSTSPSSVSGSGGSGTAPKRNQWVVRSDSSSEEWGALSEYMKERHPTRKAFYARMTLQKYQGWTELPDDRGENFLTVQSECAAEAAKISAETEEIDDCGEERELLPAVSTKMFEVVFDKLIVATPQKMHEPLAVVHLGDAEAAEDI